MESTTREDRKSTRLNSSHLRISYAVFCLKKKKYREKLNHVRTHATELEHIRIRVAVSPRGCFTDTQCISVASTHNSNNFFFFFLNNRAPPKFPPFPHPAPFPI